jgi:polar amino acid transport system substrate-binding protein
MKLSRRTCLHLAAGAAALPAVSQIAKTQTVTDVQQVCFGYPPFGEPLAFLPGATPQNYSTLDSNSAQGAMIDLYKAIANDAGFQVRFQSFVAGDLAGALSSGKVDVLSAAISDRNQRVMEISEPIYADSEVLIAHKTDTTPYKTYADLKGQIVGSRTGTIYEDDLKKNGIEVRSYVTGPELYNAVNAAEVKVAINTRYVPTAYALLRGAFPNVHIVKSYQAKFTDVTGIGTRKDQSALLGKINASLVKLKADGTVKAIFAKYGIADALTK